MSFDDKARDIVERLNSYADIDAADGVLPAVVAMTREAAEEITRLTALCAAFNRHLSETKAGVESVNNANEQLRKTCAELVNRVVELEDAKIEINKMKNKTYTATNDALELAAQTCQDLEISSVDPTGGYYVEAIRALKQGS